MYIWSRGAFDHPYEYEEDLVDAQSVYIENGGIWLLLYQRESRERNISQIGLATLESWFIEQISWSLGGPLR